MAKQKSETRMAVNKHEIRDLLRQGESLRLEFIDSGQKPRQKQRSKIPPSSPVDAAPRNTGGAGV